ncbi:Tail-specific protease precursor [compost metagenome]
MKVFSLILFLITFSLSAQNSAHTCEILSKINTLLQKEHIQPKPIDDSLSVYIFDSFIDELDPARSIFLKSEYNLLSQKYRLNIDDKIKSQDCSFLTEITTVYRNGLLRNKSIIEKIGQGTIDYQRKDTIRFYKKAFPVYLLDNEVEKVWTKKIQYEILDDITEISQNLDSLKSNFVALEIKSKNDIIQNELCRITALLNSQTSFEESLYNHFCSYFDPHTTYFSNDTKSSFVSSMSKEHLSMGINLSMNEKNEIIIDEIDPNGPAFQTGKIKKGDQIISISNQKETLLVSCASIESIANMIQSDTNKHIVLTLKRNSGKNFDVTIEKQVITDEENTVFSFVVKKSEKIGYLKIPSFYADLEDNNIKGCADDVAKELIKLEKDNIKGLVIDLMDNGGGSMEEAVKLASMFIDSGAFSIILDKDNNRTIIEDPYNGMLYKGPIVVLINSNSASASEFFASIMQDYNRALLIGSRTLGKATMQTILPLEDNDDQNFVKVTINKFYRISGKSHQGTGVVPNVKLPEIYEDIYPKENDFTTAFANDSINIRLKFRPYLKNSQIQTLTENSKKRVSNDAYFTGINEINGKIDSLLNKTKRAIPMTIEAVFEEQKIKNDLWEEISSFDKKDLNLNVDNSTVNKFLLALYPADRLMNQLQIDALKTNHYLNEATTIIQEFNAFK